MTSRCIHTPVHTYIHTLLIPRSRRRTKIRDERRRRFSRRCCRCCRSFCVLPLSHSCKDAWTFPARRRYHLFGVWPTLPPTDMAIVGEECLQASDFLAVALYAAVWDGGTTGLCAPNSQTQIWGFKKIVWIMIKNVYKNNHGRISYVACFFVGTLESIL